MSALYLKTNDFHFIRAVSDINKFNSILKNFLEKETTKVKKEKFDWFFSDEYKKIEEIKLAPTKEDIAKYLLDEKLLFVSWEEPSDDLLETLVIRDLPLVNGILTEQEIGFDVKDYESLQQKLNLEVVRTSKDFSYLAGAETQIEIIEDMFYSYEKKRMSKLTIFLLGIPGAGKTYLAECIAGQYGMMLIKLDLSKMMQHPKPIIMWHYFCRWMEMLHYQGIYVVALLDEIAQALAGGNSLQNQFKGQLLTTIEDFNTERGYQVGKSLVIATDNNIRQIMLETPQFMARFEEKLFINFPKEEEAKSILGYYLKDYGAIYSREHQGFDKDDLNHLFNSVADYYHHEKIQYNGDEIRFIYAPREINKFASRLATISEKFFENNPNEIYLLEEYFIKCCKRIPPQQKMLKMGISSMINDAGSGFIEI